MLLNYDFIGRRRVVQRSRKTKVMSRVFCGAKHTKLASNCSSQEGGWNVGYPVKSFGVKLCFGSKIMKSKPRTRKVIGASIDKYRWLFDSFSKLVFWVLSEEL